MDDTACALTKASSVTTIDQWFTSKTPIKLGGERPVQTTRMSRECQSDSGSPIQLIEGYKVRPTFVLPPRG
jgi:hypothetical protein